MLLQRDNKAKEVDAMEFPGGLNIQQMMKQAQVMQEKMSKEMEELRTEASAGGGGVTVGVKVNDEICALKIEPEAVKEGDVEMLQDMILAAINEANRKVDEAMKGKLGGMLPPGLGGLLGLLISDVGIRRTSPKVNRRTEAPAEHWPQVSAAAVVSYHARA